MEAQLKSAPKRTVNAAPSYQEPWISVIEAAAHLGVKRDTLYKWLDRKDVPAHKVGRLWKFKLSEIDAWVRQEKIAKSERSF